MKVINVSGGPLYCSYAKRTPGGTTLQHGQSSAELPLTVVHMDILWKEIHNGKVIIRLSEADKEFIAQLQHEDKKLAPPPKKAAPKAPKAVKKVKESHKPTEKELRQAALRAAKHTPGMPVFTDEKKATSAEIQQHMGDMLQSKQPQSLADLQRQNAKVK